MRLKYLHHPSMVHVQFYSKTIVEEEKSEVLKIVC